MGISPGFGHSDSAPPPLPDPPPLPHRVPSPVPVVQRTLGFPGNRRDGARQLSVAILVAAATLVRIDHPVGRVLALLSTALVLIWWELYRRLER